MLAAKAGDGALAGTCRADGRDVAIRLVGRVGGLLAVQVLEERQGLSVVGESTDVAAVARSLQAGPKVVTCGRSSRPPARGGIWAWGWVRSLLVGSCDAAPPVG